MKIEVGNLDKILATGETDADGKAVFHGPNAAGVERLANDFRRQLNVEGDDLLQVMLNRLNGMTWAAEVQE